MLTLVLCPVNDWLFSSSAAWRSATGLDAFERLPTTGKFRRDRFDGGGPDKGLGTAIPSCEESCNRGFKILHARKAATAHGFLRQFSEPALHQVQP